MRISSEKVHCNNRLFIFTCLILNLITDRNMYLLQILFYSKCDSISDKAQGKGQKTVNRAGNLAGLQIVSWGFLRHCNFGSIWEKNKNENKKHTQKGHNDVKYCPLIHSKSLYLNYSSKSSTFQLTQITKNYFFLSLFVQSWLISGCLYEPLTTVFIESKTPQFLRHSIFLYHQDRKNATK